MLSNLACLHIISFGILVIQIVRPLQADIRLFGYTAKRAQVAAVAAAALVNAQHQSATTIDGIEKRCIWTPGHGRISGEIRHR